MGKRKQQFKPNETGSLLKPFVFIFISIVLAYISAMLFYGMYSPSISTLMADASIWHYLILTIFIFIFLAFSTLYSIKSAEEMNYLRKHKKI